MINPEDKIYIDTRTSCTKDEAIAKLLGWMQGDIRHQYILITLDGVPADALAHMHSFEGSIWDFLTDQRKDAQMAYSDAFEANAAEDDLYKKEQNIVRVQETIIKAKSYQRDIDDELAKGGQSTLKIDEPQSTSAGVTHISLTTLDSWAMKKYGISVLDFSKSKLLEKGIDDTPAGHAPVLKPADPVPVVEVDIDDSDVKDGLKKTVANNLYITFSLLLDDFISSHGNLYCHPDGRPNVANVVKYIQDLAAKATEASKGKAKLPGQGTRTLQTHITKATATKREALK